MSNNIIFNSRGIGLVEVVIAIFLVTVAVLAILSMQPSAWRTVGKSDYLGRGAAILHRELERQEACIMNACNTTINTAPITSNILVSGLGTAAQGDATYTVQTTIAVVGANQWRITVTVTWGDQIMHNYRNLTESILVTRVDHFRFPVNPLTGNCTVAGACPL
jgi:Tfp pilus assembly protein PilV